MHVPVRAFTINLRARSRRPLSFLICWRRRPSINPGHFIGVGGFDRPDCHRIAQPTSVDFALCSLDFANPLLLRPPQLIIFLEMRHPCPFSIVMLNQTSTRVSAFPGQNYNLPLQCHLACFACGLCGVRTLLDLHPLMIRRIVTILIIKLPMHCTTPSTSDTQDSYIY